MEKKVGSTYTEVLYDQSGESLGENDRNTWTQSYVNFAGRHLAIYQNNATYFTHVNSLGSTVMVSDYTGAIVEDKLFYPWGQDWQTAGTLYEERFAKLQHRDTETSFDPTPNRMFSSLQGRWLSPDPLFGSVSNPQSLNRYAYVNGNPCTLADPLGLDSEGPPEPPNPFLYNGEPVSNRVDDEERIFKFGNPLFQALNTCTKRLFGVALKSFSPSTKGHNGSFVGVRSNGQQLSVTNDVNSFTVQGLNVIKYGQPTAPGGHDILGFTYQGLLATKYFLGIGYAYQYFSPSTNYTGSDLGAGAMLATQIHELGHSLAWMLGLAPVNTEDKYAGELEDCVNQERARLRNELTKVGS